jgi:4-amino-4-deoxy-L-arabinose transferase-like glycosyltransferase
MSQCIPPRPSSTASRDLSLLGVLALAKFVLHMTTSHGYGIFRDELYYIACSEHLSLGYVDHPPLSILLLWVSRATLGDSLPAIRFLPAVAGAATVFLTGLMARELGGRRRAQVLAAVCAFVAPGFLALNHFFSMNAFDLLLWALLACIAIRILARDEHRLWIVFGVVAGLGLQNKYSVALFGFGLILGLLLTPQRRQLANRWIWIGGGLAFVLFLPHLLWQIQHGWPSLEFISTARAVKLHPVTPVEFLVGQIVLVHPLAFPIWLTGLGALLFTRRMERLRPLGWAYVVVFALLLLLQGKVLYLVAVYPMLLARGSVAIDEFFERRRLRGGVPVLTTLLVVGGLATFPLAVPVLPVESFITYFRAVGVGEPKTERHEPGQLPQLFADMHGWEELVETVSRVHQSLAPAEQSQALIFTRNYGEAGAIGFLGRAYGLPPAISGHNSYHLWGPGDRSSDVLIVLGGSREELSEWCEGVQEADTVRCTYCMPYQNNLPVYVCRGLKVPLEEAWSRLKHYE